jgi:uncharacterized protein (UPF0332 family)
MNTEARDFWQRALKAAETAESLVKSDSDASASRSYYAAFYAVSALFADCGRTFPKHSAVESAVHRDLVKTGKWTIELGAAYSTLASLRATGDYGGGLHVDADAAKMAFKNARAIIEAAHKLIEGESKK